MLNEPQSGGGGRRPHPLESQPKSSPPKPPDGDNARQRVMLHIPSVEPHVTYILIAINVFIFLARSASYSISAGLADWGANNPVSVLVNGEYHRLISSMFLHASIYLREDVVYFQSSLHILFNMYALYVVGRGLERVIGHRRFFIFYFLGGLGGSVLSAVLRDFRVYTEHLANPDLIAGSVGASGAVFAIFAAEFVFLYRHRKLLGASGRAQMRNLAILGIMNLAIGFASGATQTGLRIDNWGHVGGLIGGLILAWFLSPDFIPRAHPDVPNALQAVDVNPLERRYWVISAYLTGVLLILIVATLLARP